MLKSKSVFLDFEVKDFGEREADIQQKKRDELFDLSFDKFHYKFPIVIVYIIRRHSGWMCSSLVQIMQLCRLAAVTRKMELVYIN